MRRVVLESPYAGNVLRNLRYARAAMADCLLRGEAPFASHLLYTQEGVLDDLDPEQRQMGIKAGLAWGFSADAVVVYEDLGISLGMGQAIREHRKALRTIEYRTLPGWAAD